ncbi:MAG: hypothetical protein WKF78_13805 [Candidatus Limnocylindrales bacterium]
MPVDAIERRLRDDFAVAITEDNFVRADAQDAIKDLRGKAILKEGDAAILGQLDASAVNVARALDPAVVPEDIKTVLSQLRDLSE